MTSAHVISGVRSFIEENFLYMRPDFAFTEQDSLLGRGIVDSMGVVELITFLQDEYGISVGDDEVTEENLGTLVAIGRFVESKRAQVAA